MRTGHKYLRMRILAYFEFPKCLRCVALRTRTHRNASNCAICVSYLRITCVSEIRFLDDFLAEKTGFLGPVSHYLILDFQTKDSVTSYGLGTISVCTLRRVYKSF